MKRLAGFLIAFFLLRGILAALLELGNDEVYYTIYAQQWAWNYFDHPPLIALLIRLTTLNGLISQEFFLRLGPLLCGTVAAYLVFDITNRVAGKTAAWIAILLFSSSFYSAIIAGTFLLPDGPELFFWLASVSVMIRINQGTLKWWYWGWLGLLIGLATMSKVSGVFLWLGWLGYLLARRRQTFKDPRLYVSILISVIIASPILFWNLAHHAVNYQYHAQRIRWTGKSVQLDSFLQNILVTIFYNNPVNILAIGTFFRSLIRKRHKLSPDDELLFWIGIPLVLVILFISLFDETLPHWSGPAVTTLLIPTSRFLADKSDRVRRRWQRWSVSLFSIVLIGAVGYFFFLPVASNGKDPLRLGKGDISLDMTGWQNFAGDFAQLRQSDLVTNRMKPNSFLVSDYWFPAAHFDHYLAVPQKIKLLVSGPLNNIHQFAWKNARTGMPIAGSDAYFIYPSNYYGPPTMSFRRCFKGQTDSLRIPQFRAGRHVRDFMVYRFHTLIPDSLTKQLVSIKD